MDEPIKMTKTQRINWGYAVDAARQVEHDIHAVIREEQTIPPDWHDIWKDKDRRDPLRRRVTMRMDADVVKFFKAMGEGYQHRINRVLRMYMHHRLAGLVEGPDTTDYVLRPDQVVIKERGGGPVEFDFDAIRNRVSAQMDRLRAAEVERHDRDGCLCLICETRAKGEDWL